MFRAHSKRRSRSGTRAPTVRTQRRSSNAPLTLVGLWLLAAVSACDGGIGPPDTEQPGRIEGTVQYVGDWPPNTAVVDLRFVALRFVPQDTTDFLQLNRMEVSTRLQYGVRQDSFAIGNVAPGIFPFSGIARQRTQDILSWQPLALFDEGDGILEVRPGETRVVSIVVDFAAPPDFP